MNGQPPKDNQELKCCKKFTCEFNLKIDAEMTVFGSEK